MLSRGYLSQFLSALISLEVVRLEKYNHFVKKLSEPHIQFAYRIKDKEARHQKETRFS